MEPLINAQPVISRPRILVVDEYSAMREHLTQLLRKECDIDTAGDVPSALALARERASDLVVANVMMRRFGDFDLLHKCRRDAFGKVPIIFYSTTRDEDSSVNVAEIEAGDALIMPYAESQLLALVRVHLQAAQTRRESIQALRLTEQRLRTLQTMMTPGVWVASSDGSLVGELAWWWEKQTGQTAEQSAGIGWLDVVHPADKPQVLKIRQDALLSSSTYHDDFRVRQRDGSYRYVRSQGAPVRDTDGNVREWIGTLVDIDDQKRAEEALRVSEENYRILATTTATAIWHSTPEGVEIEECQGWETMTGQTPQQSQGVGWTEVIHPDDKERAVATWRQCLRDASRVDMKYRVRRPDGSYGYIRTQGGPVWNADGSVREWIGMITDIADQERAEEALRLREEELRANWELAGIGQVQTDPKTGRYVRLNNRFCEMVGYSNEELLTMTDLELTHPDDRAASMASRLDMLRGVIDKYTADKRYVRKDGSVFWCLVTWTLIRDGHGRPLRIIKMIEDVTERRQSEAFSQCQKKALEMVARGASLAEVLEFVILAVEKQATVELRGSIFLLDNEGKELRLCAAPRLPQDYRDDFAVCQVDSPCVPRALAVFQKLPVIVTDVTNAPELADIANALMPYAIRSIWAMPIIGSDQSVLGSLCLYSSKPRTPGAAEQAMIENVIQTIALAIERKQAEAEREELLIREQAAREQAEAANRLKDEFLAVVSHELRTPLNAINGWVYMLLSGIMDRPAQLRALHSVQRQVHSQCQLIDDLLDVARIVSGKLRLEVREVDPSKIIAAALDVVRPAADAKQIALVALLDPSVTRMSADPERLQQVIWNLLSNAIKFTSQGGRVEIRLQHTDSSIEIVVADNGQGIAEDFLPYVFDRFRQADVSTTRTHGGIGLGLAIVRHLIELHGGSVFVESPGKGKGSTFTVRLPVRSVPARSSKIEDRKEEPETLLNITAEDKEVLKGLRVLVVEDNPEDREVLFAELTQQGACVSASASAAAGLAELEEFRPDVLVADIAMPGEDGYSLIRKIRSYPADHGGLIPAIALTAFAGKTDRKHALEAGYQQHMTKPANPIELAQTICHVAHHMIPVR
jgi:PAS domain S-box-containing protein